MPSDMKERELVDEGEDAQHHGFCAQPDDHVADSHGQRGSGVLELVEVTAHDCIRNGLKHQQKDETRDSQVDQIGNLRHQEISVAQIVAADYADHKDFRRSMQAERRVSSALIKREFCR